MMYDHEKSDLAAAMPAATRMMSAYSGAASDPVAGGG
jgi:hypothetical protein